MRTEEQMYDLILQIAQDDERIRAVYMNGSRTNKNAPKDIFQDYDIVYVVKKTAPFIEDKNWINKFGEISFMQYPDESPYFPSDKENSYGYLMMFKDGNRIDLTLQSESYAKAHIKDDKLCKILLDKDNLLPQIPQTTDEDYHVQKPTEEQFLASCNEFWWCLNNVAKGLWRGELPYVNDMLSFVLRKELEKLISWKIGIKTDFSVSTGKSAKYMYKWISEEEYKTYLSTYSCGSVESCREATFRMVKLFSETALFVAKSLEFEYNQDEEKASVEYLQKTQAM
ncbi:MAG: aminoglycoside 6-adenylyltransferase [Treponema sp.]|nr:aminoglycoside 6-adenylyltransferase [Treponema sp.]